VNDVHTQDGKMHIVRCVVMQCDVLRHVLGMISWWFFCRLFGFLENAISTVLRC
jgi:hypothetical protein